MHQNQSDSEMCLAADSKCYLEHKVASAVAQDFSAFRAGQGKSGSNVRPDLM